MPSISSRRVSWFTSATAYRRPPRGNGGPRNIAPPNGPLSVPGMPPISHASLPVRTSCAVSRLCFFSASLSRRRWPSGPTTMHCSSLQEPKETSSTPKTYCPSLLSVPKVRSSQKRRRRASVKLPDFSEVAALALICRRCRSESSRPACQSTSPPGNVDGRQLAGRAHEHRVADDQRVQRRQGRAVLLPLLRAEFADGLRHFVVGRHGQQRVGPQERIAHRRGHVARGIAAEHQPAFGGRGLQRPGDRLQPAHGLFGLGEERARLPRHRHLRLRIAGLQRAEHVVGRVGHARPRPAGGQRQRERRLEPVGVGRAVADALEVQRRLEELPAVAVVGGQQVRGLGAGGGEEEPLAHRGHGLDVAGLHGLGQIVPGVGLEQRLVDRQPLRRQTGQNAFGLGLQAPQQRHLDVGLEGVVRLQRQDLVQKRHGRRRTGRARRRAARYSAPAPRRGRPVPG